MQRQGLSSDTTALEPIPCGYDVVQSHKVLAQGDFILPFFYSQTGLFFEKKLNMAEENNVDTWNNIKQRGSWEEEGKIFQIMRFLAWDRGGCSSTGLKTTVTTHSAFHLKVFFLVYAVMLTMGRILWLCQEGFIRILKHQVPIVLVKVIHF